MKKLRKIDKLILWVTAILFFAYAFLYTPTYQNSTDLPLSIRVYDDYSDLLARLEKPIPLTINIAGFGGAVFTGMMIYNGIKESPAHVTVHVKGSVHSMHAMLLCAADEVTIADNVTVMYHHYQYSGTMTAEQKAAYDWQADQLYSDCIAVGLLTDEEVEYMKNGGEIWLTADQVRARLNKAKK